MINNLFLLFFFFFSALAACCRSIFRCQGSGGNFQSVIGRQAKRSVVGRAMKLFPRTRISQTSPCTDGETIRLLTKKQLYHHLEGFPSRSSTSVFFESVSIWRCLMCVSQSDKALVLVDISHHISTSQLEEPVHSVICQQVLRLCQMQRYKRQSSNRGKPWDKMVDGERADRRCTITHWTIYCGFSWRASSRRVHSSAFVSERLACSGKAEDSDLTESVKGNFSANSYSCTKEPDSPVSTRTFKTTSD